MSFSLLQLRAFVLGLLLILTGAVGVDAFAKGELLASVGQFKSDGLLTVAFLDVGQGDSIYIETPDGVQLLIDGGADSGVLRELADVMPLFDRTLDVVLATHSDKDHIGGLVDVLKRYTVKNIIRTENKNDTSVTEVFAALTEVETDKLHIASAGQQLQLGVSTTLAVLSPQGDPREWESNTASIVTQLQYGETAFMLTGDAPLGIEEYLAESYGALLQSEVLKLGHHGSRTSTADSFLAAVDPRYAVVSAGKNNSYGHPHESVVAKVQAEGAGILSTATAGTVVFKSDGKRVWVE
jgi:competence protein ComEC